MDGSASDLGDLRVYDGAEKSRMSTSVVERCCDRVRQEESSDWIGKRRDIKLPQGRRVSNLIKIFDNQSAIYNPGANFVSVSAVSMSLIGSGGDHGGTGEDPTHPKPSTGAILAVKQTEQCLAIMSAADDLESNWGGAAMKEKNSGPETMISGETNLDDEFCMEEEAEEEAPPVTPTVLARYYLLKAANFNLIHKHFTEVWRIRGKMIFKPLKDNFFIITFNREGDYKFVEQGGPWIHLGVACLIAPFVDSAQPSEAVLDIVRLWVRFYDVPWKKQTKEYGELLGSKFGKVVTVDVDAEGLVLSEYLWVRIDWPLNQRLLARFKITKEQQNPMIYHMRYE
ncbi:hypothetical protein ACQ4PT_028857 [Festuca glaucescens]